VKYFTLEEIAESLGVNVASVHRWAESGKLQYSLMDDGAKKFSTSDLAEFAAKYNISMRFLFEQSLRKKSDPEKIFQAISAAQ